MSTFFFRGEGEGGGGVGGVTQPEFYEKFLFSKAHHAVYRWKDNFMLINICNRTEVQKCTVFKINKKYPTP